MKKFKIGDQVQVTGKCLLQDYDVNEGDIIYCIITDMDEETEEKVIDLPPGSLQPRLRTNEPTGKILYRIAPLNKKAFEYKGYIEGYEFYSYDLKLIYRPNYIK